MLTSNERLQKYKHLYEVNSKTSHYLLSKVFRAKEALDQHHPDEAKQWKDKHPDSGPSKGGSEEAEGQRRQ